MRISGFLHAHLLASAAVGTLLLCYDAGAQTNMPIRYSQSAQPLAEALRQVAAASGWEIFFSPGDVAGLSAPALDGEFTTETAIERLLAGTSLNARFANGTIIIRGRSAAAEPVGIAGPPTAIVVTGSRLKGVASPSPTIVIDQTAMRDQGQTNLGDVVRSIPQSFGGGQNVGVGLNVPASSGVNVGSGSSINLRGLGSDATLTLLNGHRLAYNASRQSIDVSAIPMLAVDRLEVVADGASAIYGSDAVAGVANIILKREFEGVSASARLGASTDGGNEQQQYGIIAGRKWDSGVLFIAYDYEYDTAIRARERSYTSDRGEQTLYPAVERHNAILSGYQTLAPGLTFSLDALYNRRTSRYTLPLSATGNYLDLGTLAFPRNSSFAIAPSIDWSVGGSWSVSLSGMYGRDRTFYDSDTYFSGALYSSVRACYCNDAQSIELGATGPLASLPAGDAKLAVGGGYRRNGFHAYRTTGSPQDIEVSQRSYYGFAELNVPVIARNMGVRFVDELTLTGALRYEDYPDIDRIVTPKLGVIYAPVPDVSLKGSWGKSFKAPTMFQQYQGKFVSVTAVRNVGGVGYPTDATALLITGGRPELKPEKATSWTATMDIHPRAIPGLQIEASYFDIAYRDRIVAPIIYSVQSLSNPIYRDLINLSPTDADKAAALADTEAINYLTGAYDPTAVVAIVDNRNTNAARQDIRGVDIAVRYRLELDNGQKLNLSASASYLHSTQKLSAEQPRLDMAGTIFNPSHFRSRGTLSWTDGITTLAGTVSYIGSTEDRRFTSVTKSGEMTTFDLTARTKIGDMSGIFSDLDLGLTILNILNEKPEAVRRVQVYDLPYDSTNNNAIGRFVSLSITKHW